MSVDVESVDLESGFRVGTLCVRGSDMDVWFESSVLFLVFEILSAFLKLNHDLESGVILGNSILVFIMKRVLGDEMVGYLAT